MPVTEYDLFKAGMFDFRIDDLIVSHHAIKRCKERNIPLEDLRRRHHNIHGQAVIKKNVIVTAITNEMAHERPKKKSEKVLIAERKRKQRQHKIEQMKENKKIAKKKEIAKSKAVV